MLEREGRATAVIEIAAIVGITDAAGMRVPVAQRSTRGVGELVARLLDRGLRHFMIGLGGSSTNDGGAGLLAALGLALLDDAGAACRADPRGPPAARTRGRRAGSMRALRSRPSRSCRTSTIRCAARAGRPRSSGRRRAWRRATSSASTPCSRASPVSPRRRVGRSVAAQPGAGAAGGLGFALQLLGGRFASGAEVIADLVGLDAALARADWAITGEGRSDTQTLLGKAPLVVARRAAKCGVPVSLLSGAIAPEALPAFRETFAGAFALPPGPATLEECVGRAAEWLADRAEQMARLRAAVASVIPARAPVILAVRGGRSPAHPPCAGRWRGDCEGAPSLSACPP